MKTHFYAIASFLLPLFASASPLLKGTSTPDGVIIYRDHADPNQFWYLPARTQCELGGLLSEFNVTYFGIGKKYLEQTEDGSIRSAAGAVLAGKAAIDITASQRASVTSLIKSTYKIDNPALQPVYFENVNVQPTFAGTVLKVSDSNFPGTIQLGSEFAYAIGARNSTFAQFAAASSVAGKKITNPQFSINVSGDVEFVGDPWSADVYINLTQCWSQIRQRYSASVRWGWFKIGSAEYNSIVSDLKKSGAIKFTLTQGSLANEDQANELLEILKRQFEAMNQKAMAGEGFFKFEPNPPAPEVGTGGGSSLFGWGLSINGAYSSSYFNQEITFKESVVFNGRLRRKLPVSMVLAVQCSPESEQFFYDLREPTIRCVTKEKVDNLQARLESDQSKKESLLTDYASKLEAVKKKDQAEGKNDYPKASEEYSKIVGILGNVSTEDTLRQPSPMLQPYSDIDTYTKKIFAEATVDLLDELIKKEAPILSQQN